MALDIYGWLRFARRRWWLVALWILISGSVAYSVASFRDDEYSASAMLLVISGSTDAVTGLSSIQASQSLAETYRELILTDPVLDRVVERLDLPFTAQQLETKLSTSAVGETQLVSVAAQDGDPARAALLANTVAEEFQSYIELQANPRLGAQVEVAEWARVPEQPFAPQPMRALVLGVLLGALLGAWFAIFVEFLDQTVKPDSDLGAIIGAPLLATVPLYESTKSDDDAPVVLRQPRSNPSEVIRLLRMNLEFAGASQPVRSITVTSPSGGEGKSTISANLAVAMAQAGFRTVLIDADLRKPTQHRIFGLSNRKGLTNLLMHPEVGWQTVADPIRAVHGLTVLSSGTLPPNPADLLQSSRYAELLETIGRDVDIVIVDTPPALAVSDPLIAGRRTDGIIVVCLSGKTRMDALRAVAGAISQGNIRFIGVVLNGAHSHRSDSYHYYPSAASLPPESAEIEPSGKAVPVAAGGPSSAR